MIVPAILPSLNGGIRVILGLSFAIVLAEELLATDSGLGWLMILSERFFMIGRIVVIVVIFVILSLILNGLYLAASRYVNRWVPNRAGLCKGGNTMTDATTGPFPSRWGPDDELGTLNLVTPESTLAALAMIKQAKTYDLSHVLEPEMPVPGFHGQFFANTQWRTAKNAPKYLGVDERLLGANLRCRISRAPTSPIISASGKRMATTISTTTSVIRT